MVDDEPRTRPNKHTAAKTPRRPTHSTEDRCERQEHRKHVLLHSAGWILVIVGLAAMALPGSGLLALFAGMAMLATQYEWADRRLAPVRNAALRGAADSVRTRLRMLLSVAGVCLVGGWGTGATVIGSAGHLCGPTERSK